MACVLFGNNFTRSWWHRKLSLWHLTATPVTTKLSNWQYFVFSDVANKSLSVTVELTHYPLNNIIREMLIIVRSTWWLLMAWYLFLARASTTFMLTSVGRYQLVHMITLLMLSTEYFGLFGQYHPCLLVLRPLKSPGHQHTWCWQHRIGNM